MSKNQKTNKEIQPKYSKLLNLPKNLYDFVVAESYFRSKTKTQIINEAIDEFRHRRASEVSGDIQEFEKLVQDGDYRNKWFDGMTPEEIATYKRRCKQRERNARKICAKYQKQKSAEAN